MIELGGIHFNVHSYIGPGYHVKVWKARFWVIPNFCHLLTLAGLA